MYSDSSRTFQKRNQDGSTRVHCYQCNTFITDSFLGITKALCEMCRRVEAGEPITEQALKDYMASKGDRVEVTMLLMEEEKPLSKHKFSFANMVGEFMEAVGIKKPDAVPLPSVVVAKGKRRKRLFDNIDIEKSIGSITDVDKALNKSKS